ncbi:unnamed protein product [Sphagnum troendelagicum]|uniref:Uncharacterized protein n=1 Tax=Sphagnum troendelagicum TaxID=128251 RepID=A0ABP0UEN1_9BRYO
MEHSEFNAKDLGISRLCANAAGSQAMVIVRILVGFSISVSSGVVPLHSSCIINDGQTGTQETLDGPVPGLLLPENFASRICAKAVVLSLGVHWISNFMIGLMFLNLVKRFGVSSVYLGFPTVHVAAVFYVAKNAWWKQRVLHWKKLSGS